MDLFLSEEGRGKECTFADQPVNDNVASLPIHGRYLQRTIRVLPVSICRRARRCSVFITIVFGGSSG